MEITNIVVTYNVGISEVRAFLQCLIRQYGLSEVSPSQAMLSGTFMTMRMLHDMFNGLNRFSEGFKPYANPKLFLDRHPGLRGSDTEQVFEGDDYSNIICVSDRCVHYVNTDDYSLVAIDDVHAELGEVYGEECASLIKSEYTEITSNADLKDYIAYLSGKCDCDNRFSVKSVEYSHDGYAVTLDMGHTMATDLASKVPCCIANSQM